MLHTLSMQQALRLWSELEQCYYGDNGYGSDTAEIYAYTLLPNMPSQNYMQSESLQEHYQQEYISAGVALAEMCKLFAAQRNCKVEIDRTDCHNWYIGSSFNHRVYVKVIR